jgi:hypothetical protein
MTDATPASEQLLKNLDQAMYADRHRLRRQLHDLRKKAGAAPIDEERLAQWLERFPSFSGQGRGAASECAGHALRRQPADRGQA